MPLQRLDSLSEIAPQAWDALVPDAQPFVRHAFLSALEDSASLGSQACWQAEHLLHWEGDRLVAADGAVARRAHREDAGRSAGGLARP